MAGTLWASTEKAVEKAVEKRGEKDGEEVEAMRNEIASYARLAVEAADQSKWPLTEHFLELLVNLPAPTDEKKAAILRIGERYEKEKILSKALAIYEKVIQLYPTDPATPELLFKVGSMYREMGAYERAISRFYTVLNSVLKVNERGADSYRGLTQSAQREIAETYIQSGNYPQALKFFKLLGRMELSPEMAAKVRFKLVYCEYLVGDLPATVKEAERFLEEFSGDGSVPECRYILATALRSLKKPKESFEVVIALLRDEQAKKEKTPDRWAYWQRKTGNEFANEYYQTGDFGSALTIYQALAKISEEAEWQWPVVYQMALCFERLHLLSRAAQSYKFIIDQSEKMTKEKKSMGESLVSLVEMARWRGEQLVWQEGTETRFSRVLGGEVGSSPEKTKGKRDGVGSGGGATSPSAPGVVVGIKAPKTAL
jgi:tetratricopeptide (TPR) repeat protein